MVFLFTPGRQFPGRELSSVGCCEEAEARFIFVEIIFVDITQSRAIAKIPDQSSEEHAQFVARAGLS